MDEWMHACMEVVLCLVEDFGVIVSGAGVGFCGKVYLV